MEPPDHLIIVCCHAIWTGGPSKGQDESEWIIEGWKKGETPTYMEHIKAGLSALHEDDRSVLMFSGGPTVPSTSLSESRSYAHLAAANSYWGLLPPKQIPSSPGLNSPPASPHALSPISPFVSRILVEERALDSYQNILFSIIHFWRSCGDHHTHWPAHLTIVSHAFKRRRLVTAHCVALGFPLERVRFVGINPPGVPEVVENEERAVEEWLRDPQGQSEGLKGKRRGRNPWGTPQVLFWNGEERRKSGVKTRLLDGGEEEVLLEGEERPWGG